jgi:hypothetical protein
MLNHRAVTECRFAMPMEPAAPAAPVMSYQCQCGRRWHAPGPNSLKNGDCRWICSCGATLTLRNGVIFAPATEPGEVPASASRLQRWVARGGG